MPPSDSAVDSILIVDDEESVRKTFREWLEGSGFDCLILSAADAEDALLQANQHNIDLAILDWNLGAGNDGLRLLEDLYLFNPDVVAIMITGFAQQATPLDAMRMGVRDYLDKNQNLDRETFLAAVGRQLEKIRPAKRARRLHASLVAFREAVEKVLPLVQSAAALNDPVPLPEAIRSLLRFLLQTTGASDGVLLVHAYDAAREPAETYRAYDAAGTALSGPLTPFARSVAGSAVSLQEPCLLHHFNEQTASGALELQPFEQGRRTVLAAPLAVIPGVQVVMELFDKKDGQPFTLADQRLAAAATDLGAEMLRQALGQRRQHEVLLDAVDAALSASDSVAQSLAGSAGQRREQPPPEAVLDRLREGLRANVAAPVEAEETVRLAEAIRVLAVRHGPTAVAYCTRMVESLRPLLDSVTGAVENRL
jgi:ActR/RegA family two-component response regulator